jgi:hypothetical protein
MKKHIQTKSVIAGALLSAVAVIAIGAAAGDKDRTGWEYKFFVHSSEKIPGALKPN